MGTIVTCNGCVKFKSKNIDHIVNEKTILSEHSLSANITK